MPSGVLAIVGPTASGKTGLSLCLARELNGEIVSADSMQVYRGMDIGTAKVTREEAGGIPHHMIDVADPWETYSAARYAREAAACVDGILARGRLPILVGGTGLYVDALLAGHSFPPFSEQRRAKLRQRAETEGMAALLGELAQVDPDTAARLHLRDEKRILRALEVWHETGKPLSWHNRESRKVPPRYRAVFLGLSARVRQDLWRRIDRRAADMLAAGLADEAAGLLAAGVPPEAAAMQAIGYKEMISALRGERSLEEAREEICLRTRQYAKRQLTWFRRRPDTRWILWDGEPNLEAARQKAAEYLADSAL